MLVIGMALVFFFIVLSFNNAIETIVNTTCTHGPTCPMQITLKTQKAVSYGLIGLLVVVGILISFLLKEERTIMVSNDGNGNKQELDEEEKKKKMENLDEEESKLMSIVLREQGSAYQSDLIKETNLSKVAVTRLLDRLEGKGLIERKRRGMTNIVILK